MAKISLVSSKYIVHASLEIDGTVDRPDIIGAVFGQTEGLLGADLELRELQRSGRIGRIEVNTDTRGGKTKGSIVIPSSLDKAETAIVGAALEIIQRIGPCNATIKVTKIEDVRVSKRSMVIDRAKHLLKTMVDTTMPDSQELADEVAASVRVMEIQEYGPERLPAGPAIDESDEIMIVEGRADVLNLLRHGFKNAIALNGTSVPKSVAELSRKKTVTAFVDGDRGGDLIIRELTAVADIDFVTKAPDGKEVEEITKKEIHKALRSKISGEQAKLELGKEADRINQQGRGNRNDNRSQQQGSRNDNKGRNDRSQGRGNKNERSNDRGDNRGGNQPQPPKFQPRQSKKLTDEEKKIFRGILENLIGTRGAEILDKDLKVLGKVPMSELASTLKGAGEGAHAVIFDGPVDSDIVKSSSSTNVQYLIGMESKVKPNEARATVLTAADL